VISYQVLPDVGVAQDEVHEPPPTEAATPTRVPAGIVVSIESPVDGPDRRFAPQDACIVVVARATPGVETARPATRTRTARATDPIRTACVRRRDELPWEGRLSVGTVRRRRRVAGDRT
jgi:hypothetical protein